MKRDGRLLAPSAATGSPWWSNIYPLAGDPQSMELGLQELSRQLYEAEAFGQRLERFAQHFSTRYQVVDRPYRPGVLPEAMKAWLNCLHRLRGLGPAESDLWKRVESLSRRYPNSSSHLGPSLLLYLQQRMLLRQSLPSRAF